MLGLFFLSVGISLDLSLLAAAPLFVLGMAVGIIVLTGGVVYGLARLFGLPHVAALEAGLLLAGGGEFAFVILNSAMDAGIVGHALGQSVLVAATLSMMCIPLLAAIGARLAGRKAETSEAPLAAAPEDLPKGPQVVIVGYGRVGRLVGEMLNRHAIAWVAAERDSRLVEQGRRDGQAIYYGDAARPEFLRRCGLDEAPALVVTMDNPEGAEAVVGLARTMNPGLAIVARARDARHAQRLYELGATDAVPETVEASLQLSETILVEIGVPMGLVIASIHERRDEYRAALNRPEALGGRTRRFRRAESAQKL